MFFFFIHYFKAKFCKTKKTNKKKNKKKNKQKKKKKKKKKKPKQLALVNSDSLENIDAILTICNIYRQSLHHYTSSSWLQTCLIWFIEHCGLKTDIFRWKEDQFLAYNEIFSAFLSVENPAKKMADLNIFHSY